MPKVCDTNLKERPFQMRNHHHIIQIIVDILIIVTVVVIFIIIYLTVKPRIGYFYCNDSDIFYPQIKEIVPLYAVAIYGVLGPLFIITFIELVNIFSYFCYDHQTAPKLYTV